MPGGLETRRVGVVERTALRLEVRAVVAARLRALVPAEPERERLTDGAVRLSTGTLYGIIKRLLAEGLIREARPGGDARRRTYELTRFGTDVARAEAARLEQTLTLARRKALFRT